MPAELLIPMPADLLIRLGQTSGICELLSILQCSKRMPALCDHLVTDYKKDGRLCIYRTYDQWRALKGEQKESARRLLLKNKEFYPYRKFLLDGKRFDPSVLNLPKSFSIIICSPRVSNVFFKWPLYYGESITITAVNLIVDNVAIEGQASYGDLLLSAIRGNLDPRVFRHMLVKYALRVKTTREEFYNLMEKLFEEGYSYKSVYGQQFLYAADQLEFRYAGMPIKTARILMLDDLELSTAFFSVYRSTITFHLLYNGMGRQRFQNILTHNPAAWCQTVKLFQTAVDLASDEHNLVVILDKLPSSRKVQCDKAWLAVTIKRLFASQYSERAFDKLMEHLHEPEFTADAILPIVDSFMIKEPWNMKLLLRIFRCTPGLCLDLKHFKRLAANVEEACVLYLALFAEKSTSLISSLIEMEIPSSFICLLIQLHSSDFAENSVDDADDLISVALNNGYKNEDCLFDLINEHFTLPPVTGPPRIADPSTELLFNVSSTHVSSMSLAINKIPKDQIVDLLMYDPNRWWCDDGAMQLATSVLDTPGFLKFIDRLSRRVDRVVSSNGMELLWPWIEQDHTILSKLFSKFPLTRISSDFLRKHEDSILALPHHLKLMILWDNKEHPFTISLEPTIPEHLVMGYALIVHCEPTRMIQTLEELHAPASFIRMACLWHGIESTETNAKFDFS